MKEIKGAEFSEAVKEGFTLVDVYGNNCGPCVIFAQTLDILEKENPFINIVKINSDENPEFCEEHGIIGVPTVLFVKDGEIMERNTGAMSVEEVMETAGKYLY